MSEDVAWIFCSGLFENVDFAIWKYLDSKSLEKLCD